jgi:hypothetical protein
LIGMNGAETDARLGIGETVAEGDLVDRSRKAGTRKRRIDAAQGQ